ncbi:MAG TPA: NAD(P)-dependent oxidoreductase [Acidimicrobiales bacterium]|nr:NAD(P)-dependent oxidoreductase [Acidimicrobiales bacterium]
MADGAPVTVLAHLAGFGDLMIPALAAAVPDAEFVQVTPGRPPPVPGEILLTLLNDRPDLGPVVSGDVRWIHVLGAGVDGFPLELVGDRVLTCSRGASSVPIAEFVLAEMLAFEKKLPDSWITTPPERWNVADLGGMRGRTLGLIGIGAIGTEVARRALAFDMEVLAARRDPSKPVLPGVRVAPLEEVLGRADHLVITAASTDGTRHLLDARTLGMLKEGVHLVNVARGALIDQDALLAALDRGQVAVASLDVVEPEPLPSGHPFYSHPRVRLSPHISWSAPETARRTVELFIENYQRYRAGQPLEGVVDTAAGY